MKQSSKSWTFRKFILRVLGLLLSILVALTVFFATYGVPDWLLSDILQKVETGQFALETSKLKLSLYGDLVLYDVRIYRKFVIGPPVLNADRLTVVVDPFRYIRGQSVVRGVAVDDGDICTLMLLGPKRQRPPFKDMNLDIDLVLKNCSVDGMPADAFNAEVSCRGSEVTVNNMSAQFTDIENAETFRGTIRYNDETKDLKGSLDTNFDPSRLLPYLRMKGWSYIPKLITRFEFKEEKPKCVIEFSKKLELERDLSLAGKVWLPDCKYRGVKVLRADGSVDVKITQSDFLVRVDPLFVIRPEGSVRGWLSVDMKRNDFMYDCVSTIQPDAMFKMAGVYKDQLMHDWAFKGPAKMTSNGRINIKNPGKRFLSVDFTARNAGLNEALADECSFNMKIVDNIVQLTNMVGRIYGGGFTGSLGLDLPSAGKTNVQYKLTMKIDDVSAPEALSFITKKDMANIKGKLYGTMTLGGALGPRKKETLKGYGNFGIKDGRVFSLPIFGGLSSMMRKIIPGLDFVLRQSHMKSDFNIQDQRMHFSDVQIEGDVLSLSGKGNYYFDKSLDFDVRVQLMKAHTAGGKIMRVITYPISKLFEFRLKGTTDQPKWYPVNFSSDLLETLGI